MIDKKEVKPNGRPSDYEPRFCEMLIEHMTEGMSFTSFASLVNVCRATLYNWLDNHPEFLDAKKRGDMKSLYWWEKEGKDGLWNHTETESEGRSRKSISKTFNTGNYVFNMINRFPDDWKQKQEDTSKNQNPDNSAPKVIVYLPQNGREAPPESIEPSVKKTAQKAKK